ncbi:hypothetical protein SASPL_154828 [Salvia splendens]|uniref:(Z)-3-hexen-1-ol acetyltransferase n=1 Tax=Salvia splendens TaxID=180675 RepID=A0A8X8W0S4_SALSN|nr:hypothetical protein SASPL_154828 [Salvia splendens]
MASINAGATFKVSRKNPELIRPAKPTPHELRILSDIDDQDGLRFQMPLILIYRHSPSMEGRDPVRVIRDAVAEALADADATLQQLGTLLPPIQNLRELLYDVPGVAGVIDCPLMLIQENLPVVLNALLSYQFGRDISSVLVTPPRVTFRHTEHDIVIDTKRTTIPHDRMMRHFFFGPTEISILRQSLPPHLHSCSRFQIVTACMWRCRTIATLSHPNEDVRLLCVVNIRKRLNPPLREGYYGNAIVYPAAVTTAEKLLENPLHYAVELVKKAIHEATEEYVKSVVDLMVLRGRPNLTGARTYLVSYAKGFEEVDVGWGKPAYGGVARGGVDSFPRAVSYFMSFKNSKGEDGIMVPLCLPPKAMDVLIHELQKMLLGRSSIASAL